MKIFINEKDVTPVKYKDYSFKEMLGEKNGCLAGCRTGVLIYTCLLYTSPSPRDRQKSRMPSSA